MIIIKLFTWLTHMIQSFGTKMFNIYYKFHKKIKNFQKKLSILILAKKCEKYDIVKVKKCAPKKIVQCDNIRIIKPCNST